MAFQVSRIETRSLLFLYIKILRISQSSASEIWITFSKSPFFTDLQSSPGGWMLNEKISTVPSRINILWLLGRVWWVAVFWRPAENSFFCCPAFLRKVAHYYLLGVKLNIGPQSSHPNPCIRRCSFYTANMLPYTTKGTLKCDYLKDLEVRWLAWIILVGTVEWQAFLHERYRRLSQRTRNNSVGLTTFVLS